ncbi:hypothetical protein RhiirC2_795020 [Rhizophagus irregularis]|uniref:Uncharacterized protein n=1 Tax=Rhizophagus irregularis TaxID=588596 RepID=A0A2N1MCE2_9GLOM|nr:hypothetical protein RhiirC2_795020 [Rhizophagus irregularis]
MNISFFCRSSSFWTSSKQNFEGFDSLNRISKVQNTESTILNIILKFTFWIVKYNADLLFADKTDLAVIPDGLTSHLQPLDILLNRSFKSKVQNIYNNWINEAIKNYILSEKIKRPFYSLVEK